MPLLRNPYEWRRARDGEVVEIPKCVKVFAKVLMNPKG
jgi:hypothetical protein